MLTQTSSIRMTPSVYRDYKRTIARQPPETCAILGGRLDQPDTITEFRFCPPGKRNGEYESSSAFVLVDAEYMNWTILNEWEPNGLYAVGIWHSHPAGVTSPSGQGGDLGLFEKCLNSDDARACGWNRLLAPISTFNKDGTDNIHGWTYDRGAKSAKPAEVKIVHQGNDYSPREFEDYCASPQTTKEEATICTNSNDENDYTRFVIKLAEQRTLLRSVNNLSWLDRMSMMRQYRALERDCINHFRQTTTISHRRNLESEIASLDD